MISIRQANIDDIPLIMRFIDENWRKGDTLATNRQFFEWSFVRNGKVTMIVGIDDKEGILYGIYAYMPYTDDEYPDCYGSIWKAVKCDEPLLGMRIAEYAKKTICCRYILGAGLRGPAIRYAKLQGIPLKALDHYYRLNPEMKKTDFLIASIVDNYMPPVLRRTINPVRSFEEFRTIISENSLATRPFRKDYKYIKKRFFNHPVFNYDMWLIEDIENSLKSVLVTRVEEYLGAYACKIVDYYGSTTTIENLGSFLDDLMITRGYEYCDIYSYGIPNQLYEAGGLVRCEKESMNIIPNYFHPFERRNVDIIMREPYFEGLVLFRADGDQDRPC